MLLPKVLFRSLLYQWAQVGVAPGYLHQLIDKHAHQLHTKILKRKIHGDSSINCDLRDHVQSRIYFFGAYEPIEAYLFCQLIRPDMHIVDAGANIGFYSLLASSCLSDRGRVFAFEPVPSNYKKLDENIRQSHKDNIEVIKKGLWHKEDILTFSLSQDMHDNVGSFTATDTPPGSEQFDCPVITLDQLLDENTIPKVDLIKMDIEGSELFALQGAKKTLTTYKPSILMEINQAASTGFSYGPEAIEKILMPLGYRIFKVSSLSEDSGFIDTAKNIQRANVFFLNPEDQARLPQKWNYKTVKSFFA